LRVSTSGFDAWQQRPESARARRDRHLRVRIRASHEAAHRHYGRPRIWKDLHEEGERVSEKRVARLMRAEGLRARPRKRFRSTTMSEHDQPVAANVLARQFAAERPNQRWVGDTTEFIIGSSGKLYLAAILDLYSRFVVGWALSAVNDRHLTLRALEMALKRRCPDAGLLHHSDQGCTYASEDYRARLEQHGIACSMSRRGNCYDNAVMESGFSTVKSEEGERFESYAHAKEALFDYIEVFYNQRRRHSTLGQISPAEFEKRAARRVDPVENCQERSFPPAPHASSISSEKDEERKAINLRQLSTESDQAHYAARIRSAVPHGSAVVHPLSVSTVE
jgi:transposase InsO family protein